MTMFAKLFASTAGLAALASAAPAAAQYYNYQPSYGYGYNYNRNAAINMAAQRCTAAVQSRLHTRTSAGGILGTLLGLRTATTGRVLQVTRVDPNRRTVTVRGLATSGQYAGYNPYGYGAYGAVGYAYQPDLSFRCRVDYRGYVRDVDIDRRR